MTKIATLLPLALFVACETPEPTVEVDPTPAPGATTEAPEAPDEATRADAEEDEEADEGAGAADGDDLDIVDNWVVWPGEHAKWVSWEGGSTQITRDDVDTEAKTLVCNKPGAEVKGGRARVVGRWKHEISEGVGRITVRYFEGDQPVKKDGKRQYTDLSIGRDSSDWQDVDRWIDIPEGTDNVRYCAELKGSKGTVWSDDLHISEWQS
jgi:hypothetical protein